MIDWNPGELQLWLVRHGQSTANLAGTFAGNSDVPLTDLGKAQARALRPRLEETLFDRVWSSDLQRAVDTARLACTEPHPDPRLREVNFGELEGTSWQAASEETRQAILDFAEFQAPGGESFSDFRQRVVGFVEQLPAGRHLIVAHGGVIRALTAHLGEDRFVPNGSLLVLDWHSQRILHVYENGDAAI